MGCDIHVTREIQDKNGNWVCVKNVHQYLGTDDEEEEVFDIYVPDTGRDYGLFGILSEGVRCDATPNLGECKFPEDASPEVLEASEWGEDSDWHSHNYATLGDLDELYERCGGTFISRERDHTTKEMKNVEFECDFFFKGWVDQYLRPLAVGGPHSVRIVFWFDN